MSDSDTLSNSVPKEYLEVSIESEDVKPVVACRGCLVTDQPLRRLDAQLAEAYGLLISTAKYDLKYICTYCRALLLRFMSFRQKCLATQNALRYMNSMGAQVPLDEIKSGFNISTYPLQVTETLQISLVDKKSTQNVDSSSSIRQNMLEIEPLNSRITDAAAGDILIKSYTKTECFNDLNDYVSDDHTSDDYSTDDSQDADCFRSINNDVYNNGTRLNPQTANNLDEIANSHGGDNYLNSNNVGSSSVTRVYDESVKKLNSHTSLTSAIPTRPLKRKLQSEISTYKEGIPRTHEDLTETNLKVWIAKIQSERRMLGISATQNVLAKSSDLDIHEIRKRIETMKTRKITDEINKSSDLDIHEIRKRIETMKTRKITDEINKSSDLDIHEIRKRIETMKTREITDEINKSSDLDIHEIRKRIETMKARKITDEINKIEMLQIEELEKKFDVKIVTLTKEQQIQQYDHLKDSEQYKKAKFKCEICSFGCIRKFTLENHMLRHKLVEGHVLCEICKKSFPTTRTKGNNTNIRAHINAIHKYNYICNLCGQVSKTREAAARHNTEHKGVQYDCNICGKKFNKHTSVVGHMHISHKDILIPCSICGHRCVSEKGLQFHIKRSHKEAVDAMCKSCGMQFHSVDALQRHLQIQDVHSDHTLRPCTACGMSFASDSHLQEHKSTCESKKEYICDRNCDKRFKDLGSYYKHVRSEWCAQVSKTIKTDTIKMEKQKNTIKMEKQKNKRERAMCEICGKSVSYYQWDTHNRRKHTKETMCTCDYCGKGFFTKLDLENHINGHTGRRFQCRYCDKQFITYSNRGRHEDTRHKGKRFNCEICGGTFTTKKAMQDHVRHTHKGVPWPKRARASRGPNAPERAVAITHQGVPWP